MKKLLFGFVLGLAAVQPSWGDALYFLIDNETAAQFPDYTYAMVKNADTYLPVVAGEEVTEITQFPKDSFADGEGMYAWLNPATSGSTFLIELYGTSGLLAHGESMDYEGLKEMGAIGLSTSTDPGMLTPWTGGEFTADVPEPTTGLLVLFGLAGLALKRKM